ncbi:bifunctional diaminohydroxyphosphoribosylaminopyrimidine deaminase/5-amino-6-(5-phosphoribosylamino)uracil reductase RibD [Pseudochryseolinea flava]|uniref:Riboflavin biosynthesis protein RibD n=2 Tax=Pseudochryseolinea flava TaxID=2059302 RepID=A0A364Y8R6_9BACT|nr:bifunctional diaminohydroxyphosphoribosylaminopyrimidine deaminase/5-amino-6-(5-phosphoribosylamino)uracil reductase RibD [Pseudochryseolinea flava]
MRRALELAGRGRGKVSPNPLVGCVIVHDGRIIGEGWHQQYGGPHAEVNAIASVQEKALLTTSTAYVTLEPCSHFGKTPPCADLLIREKIQKVVIANVDINPLVSGAGIRKLRAAGIEVITGILDHEAKELNKRFFTAISKNRPYIILKWAQTTDGFVARENYDSKWISNEYSRQLVHRWRTEEDAILVGMKTAQHDNPQLNVRDWTGRNPTRVVIDRFLKLSLKLNLFDGTQKTICYNVLLHEERDNNLRIRIAEENFLPEMLQDLHKRKLHSLIVEGGSQTLSAFIALNLWDEARVFVSPQRFQKGIAAPIIKGETHFQQIATDVLQVIYNR